MIQLSQTSECSGCSACANICPHDAIRMNPDALGFLYPSVDKSKCTDCGLCEKVCAFNDHYDVSANLSSPLALCIKERRQKKSAMNSKAASTCRAT